MVYILLCLLWFVDFPISFRDHLLALGQSCDCAIASEWSLKDMGKCIIWIYKKWWCNHNKTKPWLYIYMNDIWYMQVSNHISAPVPVKQLWRTWINAWYKPTKTDDITMTMKQHAYLMDVLYFAEMAFSQKHLSLKHQYFDLLKADKSDFKQALSGN